MKFLSDILRKRRVESLEAHAYYQGAHMVDPKEGIAQVQATFDQEAAKASHDAVARAKKHEALLDRVRALLPDAQTRAAQVNARIGDRSPQYLLPLIAVTGAAFIAVAEVVLLAPSFDVLGIADPLLQYFTATGFMIACALAFHLAWESITSDRFPKALRIVYRIVALGITLALIFWGIFRGRQVAFASDLNHNPLGGFLAGHPFLASVFYVFVTLMTPLVLASATHYAFHHLRDWWEWKTANAKLNSLNKNRVAAQKALDTEREQQKQVLKKLAYECAQWKATYRLNHERGAKHLAVQEPVGLVYLKSALAALVAGMLLCWAPAVVPIFGSLAAGIAAFLYFRRKREHPNPEEYYKIQRVQFAPVVRNITQPQEPPVIEASTTPSRRKKGLLP